MTSLEALNIHVLDQADESRQILGRKRAEKGFLTAKGPTDAIHQMVQIMELAGGGVGAK